MQTTSRCSPPTRCSSASSTARPRATRAPTASARGPGARARATSSRPSPARRRTAPQAQGTSTAATFDFSDVGAHHKVNNFVFNRAFNVDMILWRNLVTSVASGWYLKPSVRYRPTGRKSGGGETRASSSTARPLYRRPGLEHQHARRREAARPRGQRRHHLRHLQPLSLRGRLRPARAVRRPAEPGHRRLGLRRARGEVHDGDPVLGLRPGQTGEQADGRTALLAALATSTLVMCGVKGRRGRRRRAEARSGGCGPVLRARWRGAVNHFQRKRGELYCENVPLSELAAEVGTPAYVYSAATLRRHARSSSRRCAGSTSSPATR